MRSSQLSIANDVNAAECIAIMCIGWLHIDGPACKDRQPDVVGVGGPGILTICVHRYVLGIVNTIVYGVNLYVAPAVRRWKSNLNINK